MVSRSQTFWLCPSADKEERRQGFSLYVLGHPEKSGKTYELDYTTIDLGYHTVPVASFLIHLSS